MKNIYLVEIVTKMYISTEAIVFNFFWGGENVNLTTSPI